MKLTKRNIRSLVFLERGEWIAGSSLSSDAFSELSREGLVKVQAHGTRRRIACISPEGIARYMESRYSVPSLEDYLKLLESEDAPDRSLQVQLTGDSKAVPRRTMKGFLVNCCEPVPATLNGRDFTISLMNGSFLYIYDYEEFIPDEDVVIVGVENVECFRYAHSVRYLFPYSRVLFVSRYPQSGDLARWLEGIPNMYVHFGDFDLAGIAIYQNEFYSHLGRRSSFFVPANIEDLLQKGSASRYDDQVSRFEHMKIDDERVIPLVRLIHKWKKGYDQEGLIGGSSGKVK